MKRMPYEGFKGMIMQESYPDEFEILKQRGIPDRVLRSAFLDAYKLGVPACEYLVEKAIVTEAAVYSALAELCGIPFAPEMSFRPQSVNNIPLGMGSSDHGPLLIGVGAERPYYVIAPHYTQFAAVRRHLARFPVFARQVRISTPRAIHQAVTILKSPAGDLECRFPEFSARRRMSYPQLTVLASVPLAFAAGLVMPLEFVFYGLCSILALGCLLAGFSRILSAASADADSLHMVLPDGLKDPGIRWPKYTVLVPLYREARIVPALMAALMRLDYPRSRLQILFLLEADDHETRAALEDRLDTHMEMITVPDEFPRTKPKALAFGLQRAEGDYVTIFDAEDRPDAGQLKKAALFFALGPENLACLQARLAIDNHEDSFFSKQYALEYACLFDQLLPWFHKLNWPFPLGGTSNHFKRETLDRVGGWDKYNVTEDADLGIRLARFGYRSGVLPSTTYEEAPVALRAWLAQRARWHKGWLQTLFVHLRDPWKSCREIGAVRFAAVLIMIAGSFMMMAIHPLVAVVVAGYFCGFWSWPVGQSSAEQLFIVLCLASAVLGYLGSAYAAWKAGRKRNYRPSLSALLLLPIYWLFSSVAFYRAVREFIMSPFTWNKTEHGLSKRGFPGSRSS